MLFLFQREIKCQTAIFGKMGGDGAAMQEDSILHDGKTEPCTTHLSAAAFVYAIESLKDAGQVLRGDAYAIIAETECPMIVHRFCADVDVGALAGIVDGVVDEVTEDTVNERLVTLNDDAIWQIIVECHVALLEGDRGL